MAVELLLPLPQVCGCEHRRWPPVPAHHDPDPPQVSRSLLHWLAKVVMLPWRKHDVKLCHVAMQSLMWHAMAPLLAFLSCPGTCRCTRQNPPICGSSPTPWTESAGSWEAAAACVLWPAVAACCCRWTIRRRRVAGARSEVHMHQMPVQVDLILWISSHRPPGMSMSCWPVSSSGLMCLATTLPFCAQLLYRLCDVQRKRDTKGHALL